MINYKQLELLIDNMRKQADKNAVIVDSIIKKAIDFEKSIKTKNTKKNKKKK